MLLFYSKLSAFGRLFCCNLYARFRSIIHIFFNICNKFHISVIAVLSTKYCSYLKLSLFKGHTKLSSQWFAPLDGQQPVNGLSPSLNPALPESSAESTQSCGDA